MARMTNAELQQELVKAKFDLAAKERELEAFKIRVREKALVVAEEQDWCDEGVNKVLTDLGLKRKESEYLVELRVNFRATTNDPDALENELCWHHYVTADTPERLREIIGRLTPDVVEDVEVEDIEVP